MTREAATFLPPQPTFSSARTASAAFPYDSSPARMSASSVQKPEEVWHGRESTFGAQDNKLDWMQSELTSLHSNLSEERKKRMELEAKLQECLDHVRQSSSSASADVKAVAADIAARQQAAAESVARTVEQLNAKAESTDAQVLQLADDSSEMQTTMHMMMNMLENCIDAKEARTLVDGCMRRIEESEEAIKQHVDENSAALTAEAEDRDARTKQTTEVAIATIEAMEEKLQLDVDKLENEVKQLKQLVSTETSRCVASLTEKVNADVATLDQRLRKTIEDLEKRTTDQLEQENAQLCSKVEHYNETVLSQADSLRTDLDSTKADLSDAKSELQAEIQTVRDTLNAAKSSLTQNLDAQTTDIRRAIATVGLDADQALQELQAARQHLEFKIDAKSQEAAAESEALDIKYKEHCEHLRELVTNVVAEHTKHFARVEGMQKELKQESTETRVHLDELRESTAHALDLAEQNFQEGLSEQAGKFKKLCEAIATSVDGNVEHVRAEFSDKLDGAARDTRALNDLLAQFKQETNVRIEGVHTDVTTQCGDISTQLQRQLTELTERVEAVQTTASKRIDDVKEYSYQHMEEISESFRSLLAQTEGEVHAVHTTKYETLAAGLKDMQGLQEEAQLEAARTDDRFRALHALQQLMSRSDVHDIFQQWDRSGDQKISKTEMRRGLLHFDLKVTDSELNELWALLDRDNSGDIDFQEFASIGMMHSTVKTELAELGAQAQQQMEALRAELLDHGASVKNDIEGLHRSLGSHVATTKGETQSLSQQITHTLDLAYQRSEAVETDLKEQVEAEHEKSAKIFESLRGELAGVRSGVGSVDARTTQLDAQVSTAKASISAAETRIQELNNEVLSQQSKSSNLSEKLERAINEAASTTKKLEMLENRHETSKKEVTSRFVKEEDERHQLAAKIQKVASDSASTRTLNNDAVTSLKSDVERRLKGVEAKSDHAVASAEVLRDESERRLNEVGDAFERQLRDRAEKLEVLVEAAEASQRETAARVQAWFEQVR